MKYHIQRWHLIGQAVGAEGRREMVHSLLLPYLATALVHEALRYGDDAREDGVKGEDDVIDLGDD